MDIIKNVRTKCEKIEAIKIAHDWITIVGLKWTRNLEKK